MSAGFAGDVPINLERQARSASLVSRSIQSICDGLYRDGPVESTLRDLLPAELREPRVAALCCTGFLLEEELAELRTLLCKSVVDPDLEGPRVLLDVGCGRGRLGACLAAALGARLVGFDKCRAAIASARAAESGSGACFLLGDFAAIVRPFASLRTSHSGPLQESLVCAGDGKSSSPERVWRCAKSATGPDAGERRSIASTANDGCGVTSC